MLQESPVTPHSLAGVLWLLLASSLGWSGAELRSWLARRKREPVELAKISAETRQITISTDVSLMTVATEALTKALHMQDRVNLLEYQIDGLKQELANADARADAAEMFVEQLNAAAKLTVCEHYPAGVRLRDYTPQQLRPPKV